MNYGALFRTAFDLVLNEVLQELTYTRFVSEGPFYPVKLTKGATSAVCMTCGTENSKSLCLLPDLGILPEIATMLSIVTALKISG